MSDSSAAATRQTVEEDDTLDALVRRMERMRRSETVIDPPQPPDPPQQQRRAQQRGQAQIDAQAARKAKEAERRQPPAPAARTAAVAPAVSLPAAAAAPSAWGRLVASLEALDGRASAGQALEVLTWFTRTCNRRAGAGELRGMLGGEPRYGATAGDVMDALTALRVCATESTGWRLMNGRDLDVRDWPYSNGGYESRQVESLRVARSVVLGVESLLRPAAEERKEEAKRSLFHASRLMAGGAAIRCLLARGLDPSEPLGATRHQCSTHQWTALHIACSWSKLPATVTNGVTMQPVAVSEQARRAATLAAASTVAALVRAVAARHPPSRAQAGEQGLNARRGVGAEVKRRGWTPLHYAAHAGFTAAVEELVGAGADVAARSGHDPFLMEVFQNFSPGWPMPGEVAGYLPRDLAEEAGHADCLRVLSRR